MIDSARVIYEGSTEDLSVEVSAKVELDAQAVQFSMDGGTTWHSATPVGDPAKVRSYTLAVSGANAPAFPSECILLVKVGSTIKPAPNRRVQFREIPVA